MLLEASYTALTFHKFYGIFPFPEYLFLCWSNGVQMCVEVIKCTHIHTQPSTRYNYNYNVCILIHGICNIVMCEEWGVTFELKSLYRRFVSREFSIGINMIYQLLSAYILIESSFWFFSLRIFLHFMGWIHWFTATFCIQLQSHSVTYEILTSVIAILGIAWIIETLTIVDPRDSWTLYECYLCIRT